jgi:hypothetical protein
MSNLEDYRWLVSDDARTFLDRATTADESLVRLTKSLRAELSAAHTHLVLEQVELRRRAREKFQAAERMFFTRRALEQATDERIAAYKARRFSAGASVADLCCGIGGDLMAFAARGVGVGVDRDPIVALLAETNCRVLCIERAKLLVADVADIHVNDFAAWHIDPDRRPAGRRTTRPEFYEPNLETLRRLLTANPNAAIKLAPGATVPQDWAETAELEWIGHRGECKQQVAWLGRLSQCTGQRRATVLFDDGRPEYSVVGSPDQYIARATSVGRFVYEPHAAVLAAGLSGVLAAEHNLSAIVPGIAYLTANHHVEVPALSAYEVTEVLPCDAKRINAALRQRGIGELVIKHRGFGIEAERLCNSLRYTGDGHATLILAKSPESSIAMLTTRLVT